MLDKAIAHGKEWRKPYYRAGRYSIGCRPHGSCEYCQSGRTHKHRKQMARYENLADSTIH